MNEILQKRIEEGAYQYIQSDAVAPENMQLAFGDFINGAKFALQNQWIPVEEALPNFEEDVFVTSADSNHFIPFVTCRSEDSVNADELGFINYHHYRITHWMPIPKLKGCDK